MSGMSSPRRDNQFLFGINSVVLSLVLAQVSTNIIVDAGSLFVLAHGVALCLRVAIEEREDA